MAQVKKRFKKWVFEVKVRIKIEKGLRSIGRTKKWALNVFLWVWILWGY